MPAARLLRLAQHCTGKVQQPVVLPMGMLALLLTTVEGFKETAQKARDENDQGAPDDECMAGIEAALRAGYLACGIDGDEDEMLDCSQATLEAYAPVLADAFAELEREEETAPSFLSATPRHPQGKHWN